MSCDDHYDNVVLLLHMQGVDGGVDFTDSSQYALTGSGNNPFGPTHLATAYTSHTSTAEFLYGTSSWTGGPGGGGLQLINNNAIDPLETRYEITDGVDFTIEGAYWQATPSASDASCILGANGYLTESGHMYFVVGVSAASGTAFAQFVTQSGGTTLASLTGVTNCADGTWHRIAVQRTGHVYELYVDGVMEATVTDSRVVGTTYGQLTVGMVGAGVVNAFIARDAWITEVRMTKGTARYTGSYVPATEAFPDSQCSGPPPPPPGSVIVSGRFVPSSDGKAIEMDRLGTIKPRIYAPVPNRIVRTRP